MANDLEIHGVGGGALQPRWNDAVPAGYVPGPRQSAGFDGSRLLQFVKDSYKLFLTVVVFAVAAAALLTLNQTKIFATKASVMLDQRRQQLVQGLDDVVSQLPVSDSSIVDTEVQLLSSAGMAYRVARATGRVPDVNPERLAPAQQQAASEVVRDIMDHRGVQRVGLTYVIDIYYNDADPAVAQQMANAYAQAYIGSQIETRVQANRGAREHLQGEIAKLQIQVKQADGQIAAYKARNNLTDTSIGGTLTEQEISSYNQALAGARAQAAEDTQRLSAARAQLSRGSDALGDSTSPALTQLRAQETAISTNVALLASRYGPNHPDLAAARQQLDDVRRLIDQQSRRSVASLQVQAQGTAGRASAIQSRLATTESKLQRAGAASVQLRELQSKFDAPSKLLEAYQGRLAQISTQSGNEQPDARIVSLASYPLAPSSPNWVVNMVLGLGAGILLGLIAVLGRQLFARGVSSGEEVEHSFGVDFLAALPYLRTADDIEIITRVVDEPTSPFAEALRGLAASVLVGGPSAPRVVAISSPFAEEGKTTTTIALGRVLAMRGRRTLVIDCDIHRSSFYQRFGIGTGVGLVDVLAGDATLQSALVDDTRTPLHFLALGRSLEPGQSLDEVDMDGLLKDLRERYDVVLLDLPPVLQVAEARIFAALADTTVLLARYKRTSKQAIDAALATLHRARASVTGVALTQVPSSAAIMVPNYGGPPQLAAARAV